MRTGAKGLCAVLNVERRENGGPWQRAFSCTWFPAFISAIRGLAIVTMKRQKVSLFFFFEMERWNQCERLDELDAIISSNGWRSPAANEFSFSFNVAVFLRVRSEDLNVFFMDTGISVTASVRVHKTSCTFLIHVFVLFCIHLCARNLGYLVHLRD